MIKAFKDFQRKALEEEADSLFLEGFATPSRTARNPMVPPNEEYVAWAEVEKFLQMAEQALKVRTARNEALYQELESARSERRKVEKTSSAAQEESSFLADHMQQLLDERAALREALETAQREKEHLARENELLRQELMDGAALGEDSSAALQLMARQQEELRGAQQRAQQLEAENAQLHNNNTQLQARVSALERANQAQATAMLSCLEESERVRLQQQVCMAAPPGCGSPLGTLAGAALRSEHTDDSCLGRGGGGDYVGAAEDEGAALVAALDLGQELELGSEPSGSFVSCLTPMGHALGSGGAGGSIFRSADSSPSDHEQQQQQQRQHSGRQPRLSGPPSAGARGGSGSPQPVM